MARRILVGGCAALVMAVSISALGGDAAPSPAPAQPKVGVAPALPDVRIVSAVAAAGSYSTGPVTTTLLVENRGSTLAANVKVTQQHYAKGGLVEIPAIINIAPKSTLKIAFTDPDGIVDACAPKEYAYHLAFAGSVDPRPRQVHLHSTCTFTGKILDPWSKVSWLSVSDGKVYVHDGRWKKPDSASYNMNATFVCGPQPLPITFTGFNRSTKEGKPIYVSLLEPAGKTEIGKAGPYTLPAGNGVDVLLNANFRGHAGPHSVMVTDPNKSLPAGVVENQGITVDIARSCTLEAKLDP